MIAALDLLDKYVSTLREIIHARVGDSENPIKQILKLNSDSDFDFLVAAMDIVGDASAAISHVQRFGLSGATKYNELGEMYLRLYGLLSATYIQQQSMLTIYRIMNVPHLKEAKKRFDALKIRKLRHKLSAHGTNYLNEDAKILEAYVPLRFDLSDKNVTAVRHTRPMHHEKVDLIEAIEAHTRLMIDMMDQVIEKSSKTLFKGDSKKQEQFADALGDLRIEKKGGLVFKGPPGAPKIVVTFVGSKDQ